MGYGLRQNAIRLGMSVPPHIQPVVSILVSQVRQQLCAKALTEFLLAQALSAVGGAPPPLHWEEVLESRLKSLRECSAGFTDSEAEFSSSSQSSELS